MTDLSEYIGTGDLATPFERTRKVARAQQEAERLKEYVMEQVAKAPPLTAEQAERIAQLLRYSRDHPAPQMRWRLRLYCGDVVTRTAHADHKSVQAAFTSSVVCPTCGLDPATIVDAKPIGIAPETG